MLEELPDKGAPVFLFDADEIPAALRPYRGDLLRPLLRGSAVHGGRILYGAADDAPEWALYIDGVLDGEALEAVAAHLEPVRPVLERRREVRQGSMPWYRLHWPRSRAEQLGPKIVCPRRSATPCFDLDVSGRVVSSDCTYLVAPADAHEPIRDLLWVLAALTEPEVARDLRCFGKQKGELFELYSAPLQALPLPLTRRQRRVVPREEWDRAQMWRARIEEAMRRIASGDEPQYYDLDLS